MPFDIADAEQRARDVLTVLTPDVSEQATIRLLVTMQARAYAKGQIDEAQAILDRLNHGGR